MLDRNSVADRSSRPTGTDISNHKLELIQAVLEDRTLSVDAQRAYIYLLVKYRNNKTGRCDPGQVSLAAKLNVSLSYIERAIAKLKKRGVITSKRRQQTSAAYQFAYPYPPDPSNLTVLKPQTRQIRRSRSVKSDGLDPSPVRDKLGEENLGKRTDSCAIAVATRTDEAGCSAGGEDWLPKGRPTFGDLADLRDKWAEGEITEKEYWRRDKILQARREASELVVASTPAKPEPTVTASLPIAPEAPVPSGQTDAFDEFWAKYPKRGGANPKAPAKKKFNKILQSGTPLDVLMSGVKRHRTDMDRTGKTGTEFVPMATTWLNQSRWEDYQPAPEQPKRPPPP
jgi:hypothetical protein